METYGLRGTYKLEGEACYDQKRNHVAHHVQEMMSGLGGLQHKVKGILDSSEGESILATIEAVEESTIKGQERLQTALDEFITFHQKYEQQVNDMKTQPYTITYMQVPKD
ncbi:hypothetical protein [Alkalicoccobacillus porphyridii]|uniref:Uncharacterized protein n=1 Tax=Alkalicoccobacillus porphyridii TaxID=2597270 RepID=A0A554A181_9BACI|nr:hypothetical protein [Alkalicoccobacillus porphyridii]TSB47435.1 hypothetical protein FN960_06785 [Alkalicoccobacillus porphyridii]